MGEVIVFDHIHLISRDPKAAADEFASERRIGPNT
jgi:hypothetical protein